jgi:hypothetical protein
MAMCDAIISKKKKFNQNQIDNECAKDLLHQNMWL